MRKSLHSLLCMLLGSAACLMGDAHAQTVDTYSFSTGTGAAIDPMTGATTLVGVNVDDAPTSGVITLPFTFRYNNANYTQFSASANGIMRLGPANVTGEYINSFASTTNVPKLMPFWDDQNTGSTGGVSYVITGTAPDRVLKVQWRTTVGASGGSPFTQLYQAWLYETSGRIEFRYGAGNAANSASIGITGTSVSNYQSVTSSSHTASTTATNDVNTAWPGSSRWYRFIPGDNVCGAIPLSFGVNGPFSNIGATVQPGEPLPPNLGCNVQNGWCDAALNNTLWFTFTAPASGRVSVNVNGFDTQAAMYAASSCANVLGSQTLLAANDDGSPTPVIYGSLLNPVNCLTPGTIYYVQVDGYNGAGGNCTITLTDLGAITASISGSDETICGGSDSSPMVVSTNAAGTAAGAALSWTVVQSGVTGGSSGSGANVPAQTLNTTDPFSGTATYTGVATINALSPATCSFTSAPVVVTVNAPAVAVINGPFFSNGSATVPVTATANGPGTWGGGTGSFAAPSSPSTTYTLGGGEAGTSFPITWSTFDPDGAGPCLFATATAQFVGGGFGGGSGRGEVAEPTPCDASASISYTSIAFCTSTTSAPATITGNTSGIFSSTTGLTLNPSTGEITPSTSTVGNYVVTYTIPASSSCPAVVATFNVAITPLPAASIAGPFLSTGPAVVTVVANTNTPGSWSGGTGTFAVTTDAITTYTLGAGEAGTTFPITWTTVDAGACASVIATAQFVGAYGGGAGRGEIADPTPCPAATISYTSGAFCTSTASAPATLTGSTGGSYSSTAGLTLNASTGEITPTTSTVGNYVVSYTIPASSSCPAVAATFNVAITPSPVAATYGPYLSGGSPTVTVVATSNTPGSWSGGTGTFGTATNPITTYTLGTGEAGTTFSVSWTTDDAGACASIVVDALFVGDGFGGGDGRGEVTSPSPCPDATFSYTSAAFCTSTASAPATLMGSTGGTYTSTAGLTLNASTGEITPSTSSVGNYVVTYSIPASATCAAVNATFSVAITPLPAASTFGPYLSGGSPTVTVVATSNTPGSWSGGTGSFGVATDATTTYTLGGGEAGTTFTITWTTIDAGACASITADALFVGDGFGGADGRGEVTSPTPCDAAASISYTSEIFCQSTTSAPVTQTGSTGGIYSSTAGLTLNASTGEITPSTSTAGNYVVSYTIPASSSCPAVVATFNIAITPPPVAATYGPYLSGGSPTVTVVATSNTPGSWGGGTGTFGTATNLITTYTLGAGEAGTTFSVSWTTDDAGACASIVVDALFVGDGFGGGDGRGEVTSPSPCPAATISYTSAAFCTSTTSAPATLTGSTGGTYTSTAGLTLNASTGEITPSTSTVGNYVVTYTIAASATCPAAVATANVAITPLPAASIAGPYLSTGPAVVTVVANSNTPGMWSGGTGTFADPSSAVTTYTLGAGEAGTTFPITWTTVDAGACASVVATAQFVGAYGGGSGRGEVTEPTPCDAVASISYTSPAFCLSTTSAPVTLIGNTGGLYASTAGLTLNASTGEITPSSSTVGNYVVTYTIPASANCPAVVATFDVEITPAPVASIAGPYLSGGPATVTVVANSNTPGSWSGGTGTFAVTTDLITTYTLGAGEAGTTFSITWTTDDAGSCASIATSAFFVGNGFGGAAGRGEVAQTYVRTNIECTIAGNLICPTAPTSVSYTTYESHPAANVFTALLSDAFGSFASPTVIGSVNSQVSGTIPISIPISITPGFGYRIRVDASQAPIVGTDNGIDLTVNPTYYSQGSGDVTDPIWSTTPSGTPTAVTFDACWSMVVQNGDVVTNTGNLELNALWIDNASTLVLENGSSTTVWGVLMDVQGTLTAVDNSALSLNGSIGPVAINAASPISLWDITVNTPQGTSATGSIDVRGTLQLDEGDLDATAALITLRSFATTTGRLGPVSPTASYIGNMKMERWIPGGATNWRLLGSPISNRRVAHWQDDFITAGYPGSAYPTFDDPVGSGILWPSIRWYDETNTGTAQNDGITGVSSQLQPLATGQGFAAWSGDALGGTAPFIVDVHNAPPHIATSPIALPMSWTDTGTPLTDGWNLVSNPVPSAIAFDQIARGADVEDYVTFYNPANGNAAVYDISLGFGTNSATNTIQSSQGFFLKANGPNVATTVEESDKINDNGGGIFGGLLPNASPMLHLRIASAINSFNDEAFVVFDVGAPLLDAEDVVKYVFAHPAAPQVATLAPDGEQLAFNCFGALDAAFLVPVSVNAGVTGTYTITVDQLGELDLTCIVLKDLVTNTIITLTGSDSYSFFLDANDDPNVPRFQLKVVMPEAGFTASASSVEVGEEVVFSNASTNASAYAWDFGDGTTSTDAEPTHAFASGGVFEVTLTATTGTCTASLTQTITVSSPVLPVAVRALLQGPYNEGTGLMNDALRSAGMLPMLEPYTAMGYAHIGGGGEFVMPSVFSTTGADAIVDWVVVELRSAGDPAEVVETRSGLLQRDGDIVAANGSSPLSFLSAPGSYHLAIRHRNHLGVMTHDPIAFGAAVTAIDFRDGGMATFGTEALAFSGNVRLLWCGDVWGDGVLKYVGQDNDRDPILVAIGGTLPTSVLTGEYRAEDVNLDAEVKYVGTNNDRDPILQNIGGSVPTAVRNAQLP